MIQLFMIFIQNIFYITNEIVNEKYNIKFIPFNKNEKKMKDLYVNIATSAIIMKYNNNCKLANKKKAEQQYNLLCDNIDDCFCYYIVVYDGRYVGYISLYKCDKESVVSFAFFLKLNEHNKKIGTKVLASIIDFYKQNKDKLKISQIESLVHVDNIASNRVMIKNGFKLIQTGYFRGIMANNYIIDI